MQPLGHRERRAALQAMADEGVDVLVIGGGVTGAGAALDAVTRGLRVGLVEQCDFAFGTSSRSSKMIHGGLRYLATGDIAVVRESLRERQGIARRVPHLVRPANWLLPIYARRLGLMRAKYDAALWAYDRLGAARAASAHTWLDRDEALELAPNLRTEGFAGALSYYDDSADDAALVMCIVRTSALHGARVANGARATSLRLQHGRVRGANVETPEGDTFSIDAGVIINATGVWAATPGVTPPDGAGFQLFPSKGVHLTVARERVGVNAVVSTYPITKRNAFIRPWGEDLAIIGTTDEAYDGPLSRPHGDDDEVEWLLSSVNDILRNPVSTEDIIATWAGLRPLVLPGDGAGGRHDTATQDVSRRHVTVEHPGIVSLVGGKLTTYRAMAEDGVNAAIGQLERTVDDCQTYDMQLDGATADTGAAAVDRLCHDYGIRRAVARHLLRRYGSHAAAVLDLGRTDASLLEPLIDGRPDLAAEVVYAARYQMARTVDDVLVRRTRLAWQVPNRAAAARGTVERLLGAELGAEMPQEAS